jgi:hypothetical protein
MFKSSLGNKNLSQVRSDSVPANEVPSEQYWTLGKNLRQPIVPNLQKNRSRDHSMELFEKQKRNISFFRTISGWSGKDYSQGAFRHGTEPTLSSKLLTPSKERSLDTRDKATPKGSTSLHVKISTKLLPGCYIPTVSDCHDSILFSKPSKSTGPPAKLQRARTDIMMRLKNITSTTPTQEEGERSRHSPGKPFRPKSAFNTTNPFDELMHNIDQRKRSSSINRAKDRLGSVDKKTHFAPTHQVPSPSPFNRNMDSLQRTVNMLTTSKGDWKNANGSGKKKAATLETYSRPFFKILEGKKQHAAKEQEGNVRGRLF